MVRTRSAEFSSASSGWLAICPTRPPKYGNSSCEIAPAAWKVPTTGNVVVLRRLRMAALNFGLLAIRPKTTTGDFAESIRRAASESDRLAAAPCATGVVDRIGLQFAASFMMSIGRPTNAAPGRSDSAARNAAERTSAVATGESICAEYFVTGLHRLTESRFW